MAKTMLPGELPRTGESALLRLTFPHVAPGPILTEPRRGHHKDGTKIVALAHFGTGLHSTVLI
jgi:hypothetical protein